MSDLWRCDENGHRLLTLREVWVYVRKLPQDSALAIADNGGTMPWSTADHLLADQWELTANRGRGKGKTPLRNPRRVHQERQQIARAASRKRSTFAKAKARRERELRERRSRSTQ